MAESNDLQKTNAVELRIQLPPDLRLGDKARRIIAMRFEQPDWSHAQIARALGLHPTRVSQIMHHPKVLAALPTIAKNKISGMVPKAVQAYSELLSQKQNLEVRRKVAERVLEDKKALNAPEMKIQNEITFKNLQEMQQTVKEAAQLPSAFIDAEIVPNAVQDTTQENQK